MSNALLRPVSYTTILAIVLCFPGAAQNSSNLIQEALKYEGRPITAIEFDPADQPLTKAELRRRIQFAPGSIFHEHDLRVALQNLYATGRFANLAVDAREEGNGIALRFVSERAYFVGRVEVNGAKQPPNSGQLISAAKLRAGTLYSEADKNQAVESIQSLLRENGFYDAGVKASVDYEPEYQQAHITFDVDPGKRARLERPLFEGVPESSQKALIRATHWRRMYGWFGLGWQPVTDTRVRHGLDNIRRFYEKKGLLETKVALERLDYHSDTNTAKPTLSVKQGQRVNVRIEGADIGKGKLIELIPMFQERAIDPDLLAEGDHALEQYLQSQGFFEAEVNHSIDESKGPDERVVTYTVDKGRRHKLSFVGIAGNHYFSTERIRERVYMEPARLPRFPYGRFNEGYLKQDVQAVQNLYFSNGFRDVKVTYRIQDDFQGRANHLGVFIQIEEGKQWRVANLAIEGADPRDLEALQHRLTASKDQVFSDAAVSADRENLLDYYYSRGYLNATFDYYVTPADWPERVNLRYVLRAGDRKYVRGVLVTGLETTKASLVFDRMELRTGEPLSLAKQTDSQRRLYNLGVFAKVNTAVQNPDSDEIDKYVLYDIDEARHYSLNVGFGAQIARIGGGVTTLDNPAGTTGFAPRVAIGLSRINLFGLGQTVALQTAVSTIDQRVGLTYFIPQFVSHENLSFTASTLVENANDIRTFTAHRREGSIQFSQRVSRAYTFQYRFVYRNVSLSNLKIQQLLVPLLSQPETAGVADFSILQDKRDNPADAHHGMYTTVDLSYAPGFFGSQTHFGRGLLRNSTYHLFGRDLVFARSTQFGVILRTGGRAEVPLAERIYSGGSTSLRAFPDFQAGPRDLITGFPLGGNAMLTNSFELRFPLFGDNLGGVIFHDAGNVYSELKDISFRFRQQNLQDFNYMVQSVGFGIRYRTPIGPVRLDLSFSPNAPRFFGLKGSEQDYLQGTAISTVQKINAFQFHFSLGQAF